jgi:hypothetical protein
MGVGWRPHTLARRTQKCLLLLIQAFCHSLLKGEKTGKWL